MRTEELDGEVALNPARARRLREKLLDWYDANQRDLPWRRTRDPYAIWISEAMLQQTRVETVIPYYHRFLEKLPDVQALAEAAEEEVYALWAGLGYYSRARNLHAAARQVVDDHGGELPSDGESLRSLPGVGRYTAGAVASIAFDKPEPIVDGNVARVLSRVLGIRANIALPAVNARLWEEAAALARGQRPGALNQALMELGALVCTPKGPACEACPLMRTCDARRVGDAPSLPVKAPKPKVKRVRAVAVRLEHGGKALAVRRESGGLLGGLWELPGGELEAGEKPSAGAARFMRDHLGLSAAPARAAGHVKHLFTHRNLTLYLFLGALEQRRAITREKIEEAGFSAHRWVDGSDFGGLPLATLTRKALEQLDSRDAESKR